MTEHDGAPVYRYFRLRPDDVRMLAADRARLRRRVDGEALLRFADETARKRLVAVLDVLQRTADGWADDAVAARQDCAPYVDMAEHVRSLIRDVGGEEKP